MGRRAHPILKLDRKFFQTDFEDYWQPLVRGSCWRSLGHFRMVSSGHDTITGQLIERTFIVKPANLLQLLAV